MTVMTESAATIESKAWRGGRSRLDWFQRVEMLSREAGLPIAANLLTDQSTPINGGGLAVVDREGAIRGAQEYLGRFIEKKIEQGCEFGSWGEWEHHAVAAALAKKFSISTVCQPQEIIENTKLVSKYLGREPADTAEYWSTLLHVKTRELSAKKNKLERSLEARDTALEAKSQELRVEQASKVQIIQRFKRLKSDYDLLAADFCITERLNFELQENANRDKADSSAELNVQHDLERANDKIQTLKSLNKKAIKSAASVTGKYNSVRRLNKKLGVALAAQAAELAKSQLTVKIVENKHKRAVAINILSNITLASLMFLSFFLVCTVV